MSIEQIKELPQIKTLFGLFPGVKITAINASNDDIAAEPQSDIEVLNQAANQNGA
jgi:hypothetical protein